MKKESKNIYLPEFKNRLKDVHESKGSPYPRPKINCPTCDNNLILCWGPKTDPYFRHEITVDCDIKPKKVEESLFHNLAKKLLCENLNKGIKITFVRKCVKCNNKFNITHSSILIWECEKRIDSNGNVGVLDIAGFEDGDIIFGIEIYYKHRTNNIKAREGIEWVELDTEEVLDEVYREEIEKHIILTDIRLFTCDDCINHIQSKNELVKQEEYLKKQESERLEKAIQLHRIHLAECEKGYNILTKLKYNSRKTIQYNKTTLLGDEVKKYDYLSLKQIAIQLGYLVFVDPYNSESEKYFDIVITGKYKLKSEIWIDKDLRKCYANNDNTADQEKYYIYNQFLGRRKCMRCCNDRMINIYHPYCENCFPFISKKNQNNTFGTNKVDENYRKDLEIRFEWLILVPDTEESIDECVFCNNIKDTFSLCSGKYKRCCYHCFDKKCTKEKIIDAEIDKNSFDGYHSLLMNPVKY